MTKEKNEPGPGRGSVHQNSQGDGNTLIAAGGDLNLGSMITEKMPAKSAGSVDHRTGILFLTANPHGTEHLRLDVEGRHIQDSLELAEYGSRFDFHIRAAARAIDLEKCLLRYQPAILHMSGHGDGEGLMVEDDAGRVKYLAADALAHLLGRFSRTLRCVVLNSCTSLHTAEAIARHIDRVIGTRREIPDRVAIRFADSFYGALAAKKRQSIEEAFEIARAGVRLESNDEEQWQSLVLLSSRRQGIQVEV